MDATPRTARMGDWALYRRLGAAQYDTTVAGFGFTAARPCPPSQQWTVALDAAGHLCGVLDTHAPADRSLIEWLPTAYPAIWAEWLTVSGAGPPAAGERAPGEG